MLTLKTPLVSMSLVGEYSSALLPNVPVRATRVMVSFLVCLYIEGVHFSAWLAGISRLSHGLTLEKDYMDTKDFIQLGEKGGGGLSAGVHLSSL